MRELFYVELGCSPRFGGSCFKFTVFFGVVLLGTHSRTERGGETKRNRDKERDKERERKKPYL